ncbi:unnamed protein product, partial [Heterosigma akashiwo]
MARSIVQLAVPFFVAVAVFIVIAALTKNSGSKSDHILIQLFSAPSDVASSSNNLRNSQTVGCGESAAPVIQGYDVVAYFDLPEDATEAVLGKEDYKANYHGYDFYFSTEENKQAFLGSPEKYVPKYGAFCSWGISAESFWTPSTLGPPVDPNVWQIYAGELLLFYREAAKKKFMVDVNKHFEEGSKRWLNWYGEEG